MTGLRWLVPVLFTLSACSFVLSIPVVRRWLGGNSSGRARAQLRDEAGSGHFKNVSQSVVGSGNRTAGGNIEEHHHRVEPLDRSSSPAPEEK